MGEKKRLELWQYQRYTLRPEVSSPPRSVVSKRGQTDNIFTDIVTYRLNQIRGQFRENCIKTLNMLRKALILHQTFTHLNKKKKHRNGREKKLLELWQYWRYTLRPEVSSPPRSGVSKRGQTDNIVTDIVTYRLNRLKGQFSENCIKTLNMLRKALILHQTFTHMNKKRKKKKREIVTYSSVDSVPPAKL